MLGEYPKLSIGGRAAGHDALTMIQRIKALERISIRLDESEQVPQRVCKCDCAFAGHETGRASEPLGAPLVFDSYCSIDHPKTCVRVPTSIEVPNEHAVQRGNCQSVFKACAAVRRP